MLLRRVQEVGDIENGLTAQRSAAYVRWHRSQDGVLSSFEYLRRHVFGGWPLDKGLLRGLLRHVWRPGYGNSPPVSVGDFGAGGGRYSEWLNETGLVQAFAFDGVLSVGDISGGRVQEVDLGKPLRLWRTFDWVICLEVGQLMPRQNVQMLLQNLRQHSQSGLVISWASAAAVPATGTDGKAASAKHDGGSLEEAELTTLVESETGLVLDHVATGAVRKGCELEHLTKTVAIFRVPSEGRS